MTDIKRKLREKAQFIRRIVASDPLKGVRLFDSILGGYANFHGKRMDLETSL